eukprot:CAMPEP_0113456014 /NCGR_PEP_ID=MMETSP0014_2-20120614/8669_1 /TAXON_ID=2857 /ORGANISM="Nitzschia sp." /LENGTH=485 /DNA_ID=CAMNT_0000347455 /DNA_START=77 /DNA_END=1534 /DNA_ORIENTATION=- /assembly_acc=CAM_ASM_000159
MTMIPQSPRPTSAQTMRPRVGSSDSDDSSSSSDRNTITANMTRLNIDRCNTNHPRPRGRRYKKFLSGDDRTVSTYHSTSRATSTRVFPAAAAAAFCLLLTAVAMMVGVDAFTVIGTHSSVAMSPPSQKQSKTLLNMAIIYGWDEYEDPADAEKKDINNDNVKKKDGGGGGGGGGTPYVTVDNFDYSPFAPTQECPTVGASVAETLSGNIDRTGSLARLAVRFARIQNEEHSELPIEEIENVRVLCVHSNSIELEATLCETHGCVSLHVPISFPTACSTTNGAGDGGDGAEAHFEACVLQHLESLDDEDDDDAAAVTATSISTSSSSSLSPSSSAAAANDIIQQWMDSTELTNVPAWWVDASTVSPELVKESTTLQDILNEDEFIDELKALARDALKGTTIESGVPYDSLIVEKSKCLSISHTGIALKIVGKRTDIVDSTNRMILDVFYPFESGKKSSPDSSGMSHPAPPPDALRKAVLGAVALAS